MCEKRIRFGEFEFPVERELEYLVNENAPETDFLCINEPDDSFSMMLEKDFPSFTVPEETEREYCLFEVKRTGRVIKFFCPQRSEGLDTAVWYFTVKLYDEGGGAHILPGQVRVEFEGNWLRRTKGKPKFLELLERVRLCAAASL